MRIFRQPDIWVFLFAWALCALVMGGHLYSPDAEVLFRTAESFASFKDGHIVPLGGRQQVITEQGETRVVYESGFASRAGRSGKQYAQYGIGQPLLAVPFVWIGKALAWWSPDALAGALWTPGVQYHDGSPGAYLVRFPVACFNQIVTALTAWLVFLLAQRIYGGRRIAISLALVYLAATMALPHSRTFFTEPLSALCVLGSILLLLKAVELQTTAGAKTSGAWALSGFLLGYGILTRLDTVVLAPGVGLLVLLLLFKGKSYDARGRLLCLIRWGLPVAGCIALIAAVNWLRFGSPMASGYSDQPEGIQFSTPILEGLWGLLLSPGRGLFVYCPPLLFAPAGLWLLWKRQRSLTACLGLCILLFVTFHAKWQNWDGGWCWGPRHIFQVVPLLTLAVGWPFLIAPGGRFRWLRWLFIIALVAGVVINLLGVSANFIEAYRRLPVQLHPLTLTRFHLAPVMLHYRLMLAGQWDLLLPELLASPDWTLKIPAGLLVALAVISGWNLTRVYRKKEAHKEKSPPENGGE